MQNRKIYRILFWIVIGTISRLIPHPPNVTPLVNLSLFAGAQLSRPLAFVTITLSLILSDLGLHYLLGYPIFGTWTLFSYSGFLLIIFLGSRLKQNPRIKTLLYYVIFSSFGFWLWTNFGVWLFGTLYTRTFSGLMMCYDAALPFLSMQLLGDLAWMLIIFYSFMFYEKKILLKPINF